MRRVSGQAQRRRVSPGLHRRHVRRRGPHLYQERPSDRASPDAVPPTGGQIRSSRSSENRSMKLAAIVYSTDHDVYTGMAVGHLRATVDPKTTEIVVIDNGSSVAFTSRFSGDRNYRYEENVGGDAVFHR